MLSSQIKAVRVDKCPSCDGTGHLRVYDATIGSQLRRLRKRNGLSLRMMAPFYGQSHTSLGRIEGSAEPLEPAQVDHYLTALEQTIDKVYGR
jgi:hypothetical protein